MTLLRCRGEASDPSRASGKKGRREKKTTRIEETRKWNPWRLVKSWLTVTHLDRCPGWPEPEPDAHSAPGLLGYFHLGACHVLLVPQLRARAGADAELRRRSFCSRFFFIVNHVWCAAFWHGRKIPGSKGEGRRGWTGGLPNWIIEPIHPQLRSPFLRRREAGVGGSSKEATTGFFYFFFNTFHWNSFTAIPGATSCSPTVSLFWSKSVALVTFGFSLPLFWTGPSAPGRRYFGDFFSLSLTH